MQRHEFSSAERHMMEASRIPFAICQLIDKQTQILVLSAGFRFLFGLEDLSEAYRIMGEDVHWDAHPEDAAKIDEAILEFSEHDAPYDVIYRSKRPNGDGYAIIHAHGEHVAMGEGVELAVIWYVDEGDYLADAVETSPEGFANKMSDMLDVDKPSHHAHYNPFTGLPGMSYFFELAKECHKVLEQDGQHVAFLFVDLAEMRNFNQQHGYEEGNRLIRAVARVLASDFGNECCGYFGQAHFAVMTTDENLDERLARTIESCMSANGGNAVPVRIGAYVDKFDSVDAAIALDRAKLACDTTRDSHMSSVTYFDEKMLSKFMNAAYVLRNLDRALDEGWVCVFYQPIVTSDDGTVCDREALARWFDPSIGFLSPSAFIPVLEEKKLIHRLDLFMVDQIIRDLKAETDMGIDVIPVSVNLSQVDFDVCDIVEEVRRRVSDAGLSPHLLNIEITESAVSQNGEYMRQQIQRLHDLGFHIWMDDFGSGYSSLDALDNLYLDLVKFDMHFTSQIAKFRKSRLILADMIRMIDNLGIDTLAEGVESLEQSEFLHAHGCNKQQGFFHSEPKPIATLQGAAASLPIAE